MAQTFFDTFNNDQIEKICHHTNNDGISCHDCLELVDQCFGSSFQETHNYFPRRISGNVIRKADLNGVVIPPIVFKHAQELFQIITEKKIYRGPTRIGVISGCIIHGYKMEKIFVPFQELVASLGVSTKKCLVGLQEIDLCLFAKNRSKYDELSKNNLSFNECANEIAKNLCIDISDVNIEKWAVNINKHCRITTAAAVAIWLYIHELKLPITIEQVAKVSKLSLTTIKKIINETPGGKIKRIN